MSSYADFLRQGATESGLRRFYYLCGNTSVWVEEALDHIRVSSHALQADRFVLWASEAPLHDIVNELNTYPLSPDAPKLVVVRDAEQINDWTGVLEWLSAKAQPKTTVVFISADQRFETAVPFRAQSCARGHGKKDHEAGK